MRVLKVSLNVQYLMVFTCGGEDYQKLLQSEIYSQSINLHYHFYAILFG